MGNATRNSDKSTDARMRMRLSHDARVDVHVGDEIVLSGHLRDISQKGLFVSSHIARGLVPVFDSPVFVKLWMQDGQSSLTVEAKGLVVRIDYEGCAISFTHPLVWWPVFSVFPARKKKEQEEQTGKLPRFDNPSVFRSNAPSSCRISA